METKSHGVATSLVGAGLLVALAMLVLPAADLWWLVAWGRHAWSTGGLPHDIPFASAPSHGWQPVPALAALVLAAVAECGTAGLLLLHGALVLSTLAVLVKEARRSGAEDRGTAVMLGLVAVGGATAFAIVRLQSFSLILFALMLVLVRGDARNPGRRLWLAPVLIAVWGNLHGAVLLGGCVLGAYLLFARLRGRAAESIGIGVAAVFAVCLTPALWHTPDYYRSVFENESARQHIGLWARLSLTSPFDIVLLSCAVPLLVLAVRRFVLWEYVAAVGLAASTVMASRNGIWLLLFLAVPAALGATRNSAGLARRDSMENSPSGDAQAAPAGVRLVLSLVVVVCVGSLVWRGVVTDRRDEELAAQVRAQVGDGVVLAPGREAEVLAAHGVRQWVVNPLDAFDAADQRSYLRFVEHGAVDMRAQSAVDAVLIRRADAKASGLPQTWKSTSLGDDWMLLTGPRAAERSSTDR